MGTGQLTSHALGLARPTDKSLAPGRARTWAARLAKGLGGVLAFGSLALGGTFFFRVSGDALGPGAFIAAIPKILAGSLAPYLGLAGAAGGALGLAAVALQRDRYARPASARGLARLLWGAPLIALAGLAAAGIFAAYTQRVATTGADFATAFGPAWEEALSPAQRAGLLPQRWTWALPASPEPRLQRDLAYWTIPGSERRLLGDLWQPPSNVAPSGLGFIYIHGGGYVSQDKGGPTETWFRHLAAQGHVVLDISYRLIPETNVPGMQGDVKRAIVWLKRNAARLGVNPDRVVLGGGSAGSHLALLAAYAPDHPLLTPEDVRGEDLSVRGVIGYYTAGDYRLESKPVVQRGPLTLAAANLLTGLMEGMSGSKIPADDEWSAQFLGGRPQEWPDLYRLVSPITHVGPQLPPTLQFMGEHDVYCGGNTAARDLHQALRAAGVPSLYVELPQTDHAYDMFLPNISPAAQTSLYDVDRFLALMASPALWEARAPVSPAAR
ncbi:MAG: alpha/beta hydrolase fold domain-containing protein [Chloroflexota bacterium]